MLDKPKTWGHWNYNWNTWWNRKWLQKNKSSWNLIVCFLCIACKHVQRLPIQWLLLYVITSKAPNLWWNNQVTTSYSRDGCDHQDNNVHIQVSIAYRVTQKYLQILSKSEKDSHSSDFFFQFQKIYEKLSFKFFQGETSY